MELTEVTEPKNSYLEKLLLNIKDYDSFHELYTLLKAPIYSYSLVILKNREDALDNVQDVFITIYNQINSYSIGTKPMNWIFTITKNKAISMIRKRKTTISIEDCVNSIEFTKEEDLILFKTLMEQLKEDERIIIILHLLWGFKHREIADILNINVSTTLSKYNRAIKKLKEMGDA